MTNVRSGCPRTRRPSQKRLANSPYEASGPNLKKRCWSLLIGEGGGE